MRSLPFAVSTLLVLAACTENRGPQGLGGDPGPVGPVGPEGASAKALLVSTAEEAPGSICPGGGVKLAFGHDADGDGALADTEVDAAQTRYVCNGPVGADGVSVTTTALEAGDPKCAFGGTAITSASGTRYVCNGEPGPIGPGGQSVQSSSLSLGDANCPNGGSVFSAANGTTYACNGATGSTGPTGPAGPGFSCANQGAVRFVSPNFTVDASCPSLLMASPVVGSTVHFASGGTVTFNVQNVGGSGSLSITAVGYLSGGDGYGTGANDCAGKTLAVSETCSFTVGKSTTGSANATLSLYGPWGRSTWSLVSP